MVFELNPDDPRHQAIAEHLSRVAIAPCKHHQVGFCKQKNRCRFSHSSTNCKYWTGVKGSCQVKNCWDRHAEPCLYFAFNKCKFKRKCSRLHELQQLHNSELTRLNEEMKTLQQQNIDLKAGLNTMK